MKKHLPIKFSLVFVLIIFLSFQAHAFELSTATPNDRLYYHRAFEVALWAMPATDSIATREAVIRDLKGAANDIAINTKPMDSFKNYRITMPEDFPARNFWSVFGYDSHTRTFIANGTKGRHLSSNDNLAKNSDGSIDIYIGPKKPKGLESNWIETIPGSEIFIGLRTYGPEENVLSGEYKIPRFKLVE